MIQLKKYERMGSGRGKFIADKEPLVSFFKCGFSFNSLILNDLEVKNPTYVTLFRGEDSFYDYVGFQFHKEKKDFAYSLTKQGKTTLRKGLNCESFLKQTNLTEHRRAKYPIFNIERHADGPVYLIRLERVQEGSVERAVGLAKPLGPQR